MEKNSRLPTISSEGWKSKKPIFLKKKKKQTPLEKFFGRQKEHSKHSLVNPEDTTKFWKNLNLSCGITAVVQEKRKEDILCWSDDDPENCDDGKQDDLDRKCRPVFTKSENPSDGSKTFRKSHLSSESESERESGSIVPESVESDEQEVNIAQSSKEALIMEVKKRVSLAANHSSHAECKQEEETEEIELPSFSLGLGSPKQGSNRDSEQYGRNEFTNALNEGSLAQKEVKVEPDVQNEAAESRQYQKGMASENEDIYSTLGAPMASGVCFSAWKPIKSEYDIRGENNGAAGGCFDDDARKARRVERSELCDGSFASERTYSHGFGCGAEEDENLLRFNVNGGAFDDKKIVMDEKDVKYYANEAECLSDDLGPSRKLKRLKRKSETESNQIPFTSTLSPLKSTQETANKIGRRTSFPEFEPEQPQNDEIEKFSSDEDQIDPQIGLQKTPLSNVRYKEYSTVPNSAFSTAKSDPMTERGPDFRSPNLDTVDLDTTDDSQNPTKSDPDFPESHFWPRENLSSKLSAVQNSVHCTKNPPHPLSEDTKSLMRERMPFFRSIEDLKSSENGGQFEPVFVDYENQFGSDPQNDGNSEKSQSRSSRQPGSVESRRSRKVKKGARKPRAEAKAKEGPKGRWSFEQGQKVYINKKGKKYFGRLAYLQSLKENPCKKKGSASKRSGD